MLFLFSVLCAGAVAGFASHAQAADQNVTAPKPRLSTRSGLGFSVDRKPGKKLLSGSFLMLGIDVPITAKLSAGVLTVADGGKSARLDNYRLASLASLTQRVGIIADLVTVALGPYTETLEVNGTSRSHRQRGTMALFVLSKELYTAPRFSLAASTLLSFYQPAAGPGGRSQGVSLAATFRL